MNPRGSGTFSLGDQFTNHLQRSYPDYHLNVKAVQGSSPAASLAADLSQNFSITDARLVTAASLSPPPLSSPPVECLENHLLTMLFLL